MEGKNLHACSGITMRIKLSTKLGLGSWSYICKAAQTTGIGRPILKYFCGDTIEESRPTEMAL